MIRNIHIPKGALSNRVLFNPVYPMTTLRPHHGCHIAVSNPTKAKTTLRFRTTRILPRDRNNLFSSGPAQRKRLKILSMHFIVRLGNSNADVQNSWRPVRTDLISSNLPLYERVFAFHPMAWILSNRGWQCAKEILTGQGGIQYTGIYLGGGPVF